MTYPFSAKKKTKKYIYSESQTHEGQDNGPHHNKTNIPILNQKKKKKTHSLVSESQTHNKHEPSRRAQGPKTQNEKTERREGEKGNKKKKKKKKFLSAIPISDSEQRQARGEVERVRV